jgi:hypothetical protein
VGGVFRLGICALVLVAAFAAAAGSAPAMTSVKHCGNAFSGADQPGFDIRASNITCSRSRSLTRRYYRQGCSPTKTCHVRRFSCHGRKNGDLYRVTCTRRARHFSFSGGS